MRVAEGEACAYGRYRLKGCCDGSVRVAKCRIGLHDWSMWSKKKSDCISRSILLASGRLATSEETFHDWSEFMYIDTSSCYQGQRRCADCDACERTAAQHHDWSDWTYASEVSCQQQNTCRNCGASRVRENHAWGVWEKESPVSDRLIRFCRRCLDGKETKDRVPIFSAARDDGQILYTMQLCAPFIKNAADVKIYTDSLLRSRGSDGTIGFEVAHRPMAPRSNRKYLTWGPPDKYSDYYVVLAWNGEAWVRATS